MTYEHNDDKEEYDKILNRIIELYDDKSKTFQRSFTLLLAFTIIFLFLIFIPYVYILEENRQIIQRLFDISNRIVGIEDRIQNSTQELKEMKLPLSQIHSINSTIFKQMGDSLEEIFRNLDNKLNVGSSFTIQNKTYDNSLFHKCNNFVDAIKMECIILQLVSETIKNSNGPLKNIGNNSVISKDSFNLLKQRLNTILSNVTSLNEGRPGIDALLFHTLTKLERKLEGMSMASTRKWDDQFERVNEFKERLLQNKSLLQGKQSLLQNEKDEIAKRLDQMQFPFAKLPLRLDDAIMVFPISLAVGFVLCLHLLCNTIRLRKHFYDVLFKKNIQKIKWTHKDISIMTPLWIDPLESKLNQLIRFTILIIPFVIFLLTWYLIINYLMLDINNLNITIYRDLPYDWLYNILYSLSLISCIYSCWKIIKELHNKPEHISPS